MVRFLVVVGLLGLLVGSAGVAGAQGLSGDSPPPWYSAPTAYHTIPVCSWSCVWYSAPGYYGSSYSYSGGYAWPSYSTPRTSLVDGLGSSAGYNSWGLGRSTSWGYEPAPLTMPGEVGPRPGDFLRR